MAEQENGALSGGLAGASLGPWGALAGAVLGAYMGHQQQKSQQKARQDQALINMYAPLFGQGPQALGMEKNYVTPGLIQGGMSGYQMGSQMDLNDKLSKIAEKDSSNPNTSVQSPVYVPYQAAVAAQSVNPLSYQPRGVDPNSFFNMYGR